MKYLGHILLVILILQLSVSAENRPEKRRIPLALQPDKALTMEEHHFLGRLHTHLVKGKQLPPEVLKMKPGEDRLLNTDGFELINVSRAAGGQHETWIAINPTNPLNMIATSNDSRYLQAPPWGYRMVAFYTFDGGKTWAESTTPFNQDLYISMPDNPWEMTIFDPGIAFDSQGNAFYSFGFTQTVETGRDDNGVFVCRSTDGGKTWEEAIPVVLAIGAYPNPFHDRYMIAADANENSPYKDRIYVTWKRFIVNPACLISFSADGGENWIQPRLLPGSDKQRTQSATPAIGPNGEVYVVWEDPDENTKITDAVFQKSTDGGNTWLVAPRVVQKVYTTGVNWNGRSVLPDKQNIRVGSDPVIAVDRSNGPRRGWIYIVQGGKDVEGKYGLYLSRSTDGGNTWANNNRIDNNALRNDIIFPAVTVDDKSGAVCVFYYSSQNDPTNKGFDGYLAFSTDGVNFSNIRLTPQTWYIDRLNKVSPQGQENNIYWGDYTSITSHNGKFYPLFWMPAPVTGDFNSLELFTAILTPAPRVPTNLNAESSWQTPTVVNLTWNDPLNDLLGGQIGDFTIVIKRDGTEIAQVVKGTQKFNDTGLENGKEYDYALKAVNDFGESMEVAVSVYAGSALKPLPAVDLIAKPHPSGMMLEWTNPSEHIDGSPFHDFSHILVYADSLLVKTVSEGITAGNKSSAIVEIATEKFYNVFIKAVGKRGDIETPSIATEPVLAYAGEPIEEFIDNFDDAEKLIPTYTDGAWAVTDVKAKSEPNSITDTPEGNYSVGETFIAFAPTVIKAGMSTLSFDHIALIDLGVGDNGVVAVSNDFGQTWEDLRWVDRSTSPNFSGDIASADWDYLGISLDDFVGDTLYIRFKLFANIFRHDDGWYIDNVEIGNKSVSVESDIDFVKYVSMQSMPNPASQSASLEILLPVSAEYSLSLYDMMGRELQKVFEGVMSAGKHSFPLYFETISSGTYYCVLRSGTMIKSIPIIIEK